MSFADLCLLLLAFFAVLHAQRGQSEAVRAGMRAAFGGGAGDAGATQARMLAADALFEPGEAVLRPAVVRMLARLGAAAGGRRIAVESRGSGVGTARFDGWELAAARAAAVARALATGGADPARIVLAVLPADAPGPQRIRVAIG